MKDKEGGVGYPPKNIFRKGGRGVPLNSDNKNTNFSPPNITWNLPYWASYIYVRVLAKADSKHFVDSTCVL